MLKLCKQAQKRVNYFSFNHGCELITEVVATVAHAEAAAGCAFKFCFIFGFMLTIFFYLLLKTQITYSSNSLISFGEESMGFR